MLISLPFARRVAAGAVGIGILTAAMMLSAPRIAPDLPMTDLPAPVVATVGPNFSISQGNIIDPNGDVYLGGGINIADSEMSSVITSASGGPITTLFPGINMIRVACYSYQPPSYYEQFVTWATGLGIVVMLENHQNFNADGSSAGSSGSGQGVIFAGTMLTTESNWYADLATAFINNPYVWFMTNNEPPGPESPIPATLAELSTWQQATYNAIRGTGNNSIIAMELPGAIPGLPWYQTSWGLMTQSVYTPMHGVIWDMHQYADEFASGGQSAQVGTVSTAEIQTLMANMVTAVQQITSADGTMPVIGGECGNSTSGASIDTSGQNVIAAVIANTGATLPLQAAAFWEWNNGGVAGDKLTNEPGSQTLTSPYGTSVAAFISGIRHER